MKIYMILHDVKYTEAMTSNLEWAVQASFASYFKPDDSLHVIFFGDWMLDECLRDCAGKLLSSLRTQFPLTEVFVAHNRRPGDGDLIIYAAMGVRVSSSGKLNVAIKKALSAHIGVNIGS